MPAPVEKIYVIVPHYRGYIQALQMYAPIVSPLGVTKAQAQQMLLSGLEVLQYNSSTKSYTKLTMQTLTSNTPAPVEAPVVEPPKETKPLKGVTATKKEAKTEPAAPVKEVKAPEATPVKVAKKEEPKPAEDPAPAEAPVEEPKADETVDESQVDWSKMTKAERRAMRAKLNAQKEAQAAETTEAPAEKTPAAEE